MKKTNRWLYAIVGCAVLLVSGLVYAWSVLSGPIAAEFPQWSAAQLSLTFTIVMSFFCVGSLVGGLLSSKVSQKVYLWVSAALFLTGFLLTANIRSILMLYIGFGVICGFASGLSYNAVLGTVGKWFPDKAGLVSGILLMGFGLSSFLVGKLYQTFTPDTVGAWRHSFVVLGIIAAVIMAVGGFLLEKPDADFVPPATAQNRKKYVNPVAEEADTATMMKRPSLWLLYLWSVLLSAAGLVLASQASGIAREIGTGVSAGTIATVVGLISIFNGIGRVIFGGMFDKAGRSRTMQTVNALFLVTAAILVAALKLGNFPVLVAGFIIGGMSYGGVTPANSAFVSSYYHKLLCPVDGGMMTYPTLEQKKAIIENTVDVLHAMGYECPKVGVLACVEKVNPKMPETVEADALKQMNQRGEITGCIVEGPVSYDCAMSKEIAEFKGFNSPVSGDCDVLVAPNIHAGNIMGKLLTVTCGARLAGMVVGAKCLIVMTSRGSSAEEKYLSIVLAAAAAQKEA